MARTIRKLDVFARKLPLLRLMIAGCVVAILGSTASPQTKQANIIGVDAQPAMPLSLIGKTVHPTYTLCDVLSSPRPGGGNDEYPGITVIDPNQRGVTHCILSFAIPPGVKGQWTNGQWKYLPSQSIFNIAQITYHEDPYQGDSVQLSLEPYIKQPFSLRHVNSGSTRRTVRVVRVMLPNGWKTSSNQDDIVRLITSYFPEDKELSSVDPLSAKFEQMARKPKLGKPSYVETFTWLTSKMPTLGIPLEADSRGRAIIAGEAYRLLSMDNCILSYEETVINGKNFDGTSDITKFTTTVPLADTELVETGSAYLNKYGVKVGSDERHIVLHTRHFGEVVLLRKDDYDTNQLARRIVDALNHAVSLCQETAKVTEPF